MAKKSGGAAALTILLILFFLIGGGVILFIIFCIVAALCFAGAVAGLYFAIRDVETKEVNIDPEFSLNDYGKRLLVDGFDDTVSTKKINLSITEDDMDNMIAIGLSKLEGINSVLKKGYMQIKGNNYDFFLDIDLKVVQTRLVVKTTLSEDHDTNTFVFGINNISIGKISGLDKGAKFLLQRFLNEEEINQSLEETGLSLRYHSDSMTLSYAKDDVVKDITDLTGNGKDDLVTKIFNTMVEQHVVDFTVDTDDFMNAYVDLEKVETNEYVTDTNEQIKINPADVTSNVKVKLEQLVNEGAVDPEQHDLKSIYEYLFGGYSYIENNEEKVNLIKSIDTSSIGIPNNDTAKENYKGFDVASGENDLKIKMAESINVANLIAGDRDLCELTESDINDYVSGRSVVGYTYLLHRRVSENNYKINYITIDNFYCNIYKDGAKNIADFICKININGFHTSLVFNSEVPEEVHDDNKMTFYVGDVTYGQIKAENLKETFFDVVVQALQGGDNSITADKTNYSISFDFNSIINDAKEQTETAIHMIPGMEGWSGDAYFTGSNIDIKVEGENQLDEGVLKLALKDSISLIP